VISYGFINGTFIDKVFNSQPAEEFNKNQQDLDTLRERERERYMS